MGGLRLDPSDPKDREFLMNRKGKSGRTLLEEHVEHEVTLIDQRETPSRVISRAVGRPLNIPNSMSSAEKVYNTILEGKLRAGEIIGFRYHPFKLRIANPKCWYEIDFLVIAADGTVECHETKGARGYHDDSMVKFKAVTEIYPWFVFKWVTVSIKNGSVSIKRIEDGRWLNE